MNLVGMEHLASLSEPARVGYLLKMYPRFTQTFVINEILELERQGLDVHILSLRLPNEGRFHESMSRVKATAEYVPETPHGRRWQIARSQWKLWRQAPKAYRRAARFVWRQTGASAYQLVQAAHVLRWARKNRLDHIHVHFGTEEATVVMLAHMLGGPTYSMTLHAFDIFRDNVDRRLLARKINASKFTVTVSDYNKRFMAETLPGVNADKIRVNYNGIDLARFTPNGTVREPMSIFAVGRLIEKKGFVHLIRAVRRLRDEGLSVQCGIAGEGREAKALRKAIRKESLSAHVTLLGGVRQAEVAEWLEKAHCFVLPCVHAKDGNVDALPTVLLESLASGCPSISTRVSGVPEIIEDRVSGLLVAPADDEALAGAIREVLLNRSLASKLSVEGRKRAETRFDIRRNVAVMHGWLRGGDIDVDVDVEDASSVDHPGAPIHLAPSVPPLLAEAS